MKRFSVCLALLLSFGQGAALAQVRTQPKIAEGFYWGGPEWGIQVLSNTFRYSDEAVRLEWRPTTELILVKPGIVCWKDKAERCDYYCNPKIVPLPNPRSQLACTKNGWGRG